MQDKNLVAIDIGTSKIALAVAKIEGDNIVVIYYKETPSDGIRYSRVYIPGRASNAIQRAVMEAEEELGIKITQAIVGLPKYEVTQKIATMTVHRTSPDSCITAEEINNIKETAIDTYPIDNELNEMLFGAIAQSFSDGTDFQIVENDVIGMAPDTLESNFKIFIGQRKNVNDLRLAFSNAGGICINREYFTPDSTAKAVLYDSEMENGVALIDLGGGVTTVSIYYGNIMRYYAAIPFGGKSINNDIRTECYISDRLVENIKLKYGACMPEKLQNMSEKTLQVISEEAVPAKEISVKYLSEIITARIEEIIEAVLYKIQESGFADNLRCGIVITGGGANLTNISNLIHEMSGYNVRTGYPNSRLFSYTGNVHGITETGAATCLGMILTAKSENLDGFVSMSGSPAKEGSLVDEVDDSEFGGESTAEAPALDDQGKGNLFGYEEQEPAKAPAGAGGKSTGRRTGGKKKNPDKVTWKIKSLFDGINTVAKSVMDKYDEITNEEV